MTRTVLNEVSNFLSFYNLLYRLLENINSQFAQQRKFFRLL